MWYKLFIEWSWINGLSNQDILHFITLHFSEKLINFLTLPQIHTEDSVVYVWEYTDPEPVIYTKEEFQQKIDLLPKNKRSALLDGVAAGINYGDKIILYNQDFVFELYSVLSWKTLRESEIEYLDWLTMSDIPSAYRVWIVSHEIWHNIYDAKIKNTHLQSKWEKITDAVWSVTKYVQEYGIWSDIFYEENFTESLRIYTTNPKFLQQKYPDIYIFISNYFPDIT